MKIPIENLKAQMQGRDLNVFQRADALREFNALVNYVNELEHQNKILSSLCHRIWAAWDRLPGPKEYASRHVQAWLSNSMKPAMHELKEITMSDLTPKQWEKITKQEPKPDASKLYPNSDLDPFSDE